MNLDREWKEAVERDDARDDARVARATMTEQEHYDLTTCDPCTCRAREKGLTASHTPGCLKRKQEERIAARDRTAEGELSVPNAVLNP